MVAAGDPSTFLGYAAAPGMRDSHELLRQEIADIEARTRRLIQKQSGAPDALQDLYDEELRGLAESLRVKRVVLAGLEHEQAVGRRGAAERRAAYDEIVRLSVDVFWQQEERTINQILHRLIGDKRLAVSGGRVVALVDKPPSPFKRRADG